MDGIEILNGVVETESAEEFFKKIGVRFDVDGGFNLSSWASKEELRKYRQRLPRDVACVQYFEEVDGRNCSFIYLTYCRRGILYVYNVR